MLTYCRDPPNLVYIGQTYEDYGQLKETMTDASYNYEWFRFHRMVTENKGPVRKGLHVFKAKLFKNYKFSDAHDTLSFEYEGETVVIRFSDNDGCKAFAGLFFDERRTINPMNL